MTPTLRKVVKCCLLHFLFSKVQSDLLPGLDEPVAGVCHVFHLEVDGCV